MVKVASERGGKCGVTGNETSERVKYSHKIERAISNPAFDRPRVERESFGGLVQICLVVHLHNFQLVLPRVAHSRSFGLIKQTAI